MNLIHKLRDAEARFTGFGQCLRCHRSWKRASSVSVRYSPTSSMFPICMECWADVVEDSETPGLVLQGYAAKLIAKWADQGVTTSPETERDILAAFGVAHRTGVQWQPGWSSRPLHYGVRPMLVRGKPFDLIVEDEWDGPSDPPGWNGAGADVEAQRG